MTTMAPWLLLDVGNTAIKWRLADEHALLDSSGVAADLSALREALRGVAWQTSAVSSVATVKRRSARTRLATSMTSTSA